jgi:hypothetical protein
MFKKIIFIFIIMTNPLDAIVGPLDKQYCFYFYFISIIFFFGAIVSFIKLVSALFSSKKIMTNTNLQYFFVLAHSLVYYLVNRIMYNMCIKSL